MPRHLQGDHGLLYPVRHAEEIARVLGRRHAGFIAIGVAGLDIQQHRYDNRYRDFEIGYAVAVIETDHRTVKPRHQVLRV
nr:hypothetical protein [Bacillota bacterium]